MTIFLVLVLILLCVAEGVVIWRLARRLLDFDAVLNRVVDTLDDYSGALKDIVEKEGLLTDHPEVQNFHRTNLRAIRQIEASIEDIRGVRG